MMAPKNIVILTPGFPSDESDDCCMPYLQVYLKEMAARNKLFKFRVVSVQYPYEPNCYNWHGIPVSAIGGKNRRFPMRLHYWRKTWTQLSRLHREEPIDVVHSLWLSECTFLAQKWTNSNRVKHITTAMGQDVLTQNRYLNRINFDGLPTAVVSSVQGKYLEKSTGKQATRIIPWGLDKFDVNEAERSIDILGVGALTVLKDFGLFLKVIATVLKTNPNIKATLIGDGPERPHLEALAKALKISDSVKFLGNVSRPKVLDLMTRSKVFLHTSTFESQGYVFNEAMANGMSIVSRKVGLAEPSVRWLICETEQEMAGDVISLLEQDFKPLALLPVQETIEAYEKLYN